MYTIRRKSTQSLEGDTPCPWKEDAIDAGARKTLKATRGARRVIAYANRGEFGERLTGLPAANPEPSIESEEIALVRTDSRACVETRCRALPCEGWELKG
jgi:hypothetical protein